MIKHLDWLKQVPIDTYPKNISRIIRHRSGDPDTVVKKFIKAFSSRCPKGKRMVPLFDPPPEEDIAERFLESIRNMPVDEFRNLVLLLALFELPCFTFVSRGGIKRAKKIRPELEISPGLRKICVIRGSTQNYTKSIEGIAGLNFLPWHLISRNKFLKFLKGESSRYFPGVQGTSFQTARLLLGGIVIKEAIAKKTGYKAYIEPRFAWQVLARLCPEKITESEVQLDIHRLYDVFESNISTQYGHSESSLFTGKLRDKIIAQSGMQCSETGLYHPDSPVVQQRIKSLAGVSGLTFTQARHLIKSLYVSSQFDVDHYIPQSKGGLTTEENGQYLSREYHQTLGADRIQHSTIEMKGWLEVLDMTIAENLSESSGTPNPYAIDFMSQSIIKMRKICLFPYELDKKKDEDIAVLCANNHINQLPITEKEREYRLSEDI